MCVCVCSSYETSLACLKEACIVVAVPESRRRHGKIRDRGENLGSRIRTMFSNFL